MKREKKQASQLLSNKEKSKFRLTSSCGWDEIILKIVNLLFRHFLSLFLNLPAHLNYQSILLLSRLMLRDWLKKVLPPPLLIKSSIKTHYSTTLYCKSFGSGYFQYFDLIFPLLFTIFKLVLQMQITALYISFLSLIQNNPLQ
ncbi:transmembrane protein, putative (macronuclear) [Tetrahymena thermophila SB210]|uniref:Transmembrane protein, putative n=1 Tax=Tetrahymena thermophila (strain SB210) TaxID=312017 RepID=W7WVR3_TETTS|nr:transmembrane protein, putative [Tetrahymena thermophila SB210]EWS70920.1 transmembrane protein, putative [Tetrahymena thermophila SB210]|eukprot:XP_012656535.1 transmembrane protein, putative [Tetrahymena thermophila SB210]